MACFALVLLAGCQKAPAPPKDLVGRADRLEFQIRRLRESLDAGGAKNVGDKLFRELVYMCDECKRTSLESEANRLRGLVRRVEELLKKKDATAEVKGLLLEVEGSLEKFRAVASGPARKQ